jgi:hypothetical protein
MDVRVNQPMRQGLNQSRSILSLGADASFHGVVLVAELFPWRSSFSAQRSLHAYRVRPQRLAECTEGGVTRPARKRGHESCVVKVSSEACKPRGQDETFMIH